MHMWRHSLLRAPALAALALGAMQCQCQWRAGAAAAAQLQDREHLSSATRGSTIGMTGNDKPNDWSNNINKTASVTIANGSLAGTVKWNRVAGFTGIPYAAAPMGALRFKAPRPHAGWSGRGPLNATAYGKQCMQGDTVPRARPRHSGTQCGSFCTDHGCEHPTVGPPGSPFANRSLWPA